MEKKKRKLRVLNPAEMRPLIGGAEAMSGCNKTGDTILCGPMVGDIKMCIHLEGACPSGFSSKCSISSQVTFNCPSGFTISRQ